MKKSMNLQLNKRSSCQIVIFFVIMCIRCLSMEKNVILISDDFSVIVTSKNVSFARIENRDQWQTILHHCQKPNPWRRKFQVRLFD